MDTEEVSHFLVMFLGGEEEPRHYGHSSKLEDTCYGQEQLQMEVPGGTCQANANLNLKI